VQQDGQGLPCPGGSPGRTILSLSLQSHVRKPVVFWVMYWKNHDSGSSAQPYVDGAQMAIRKVNSLIGLRRGLDIILDLS